MATPSKTAKIGKYDVVDTIGRGGMGVVYLAKDPDLDRLVAIKMMNVDAHESGDFLERFKQEAKATASLEHPNIVTIYDFGAHQGRPFLVMKYLEGNSLEVLLRAHHPMSLLDKLNVVIEVCQGLGYAHQRGIVHRDIKPANIMVLNDGSVKIVDFGIARLGDHSLTKTGQIVGSLNYMPPEQIREQGIDTRADIYSAGVVLYQLLTYALPFEGESTVSTLAKIISDDPPPFRQFGISCPPELEAITLKALAKNRDQRYGSAEAFAGALSEVQDRLKQQAISEYLSKAELLQQNDEFVEAQEYLGKVLKLDRQNTTAAKLLIVVRARLQAQLSAERIRQLKLQADEAFKREDFDAALVFINQAIDLDNNPDLQTVKARIAKAKTDTEVIRKAITRAEAAQRSGDLDSARSAIEAAFSLSPNDSNVRALRRAIARDIEDRERQKRVENLLDEARKQMFARKFTSALDLLREAQQLDPSAPQLRLLLERLASEHQQEKGRRELEQFGREVQAALDKDDYKEASGKAAEALLKFPNEPSLKRLKELADTQIKLAAQRQFVKSQSTAAQEFLDAGHTHRALETIESALKTASGNARLESFRSMLLDRLAKDRDEADRSTCLRQANEAIVIGRYADAIQLLETARIRFADAADLDQLLHSAREQDAQIQLQISTDQAMRHAQQLLAHWDFEGAVRSLQRALQQFPSEDLDLMLKQALVQRDTFAKDIKTAIVRGEALIDAGAIADAKEFLGSRPESYKQSAEFLNLLRKTQAAVTLPKTRDVQVSGATQIFSPEFEQRAGFPQEKQRTAVYKIPTAAPATSVPEPTEATKSPSKVKSKLIGIAAAILVLAIGGIIWLRSPAPKTTTLIVETTAGAQIFVDEKLVEQPKSDGHLSLSGLRAGHHRIRTSLDGYNDGSADVVVEPGQQTSVVIPVGVKIATAAPERPQAPLPQAPKLGTLILRSNPPQVDVYIDGQFKKTTGRDGRLELKLDPGSYKLKVGKNGYADSKEQRIEVAPDKENTLPLIALKPVAPSPGTQPPVLNDSYLIVESTPGANVRVNGSDWGNIGNDGSLPRKVQPGSYELQVSKSGYESQASTVDVAAGERKSVSAILRPNALPPPPPAPKPSATLSADSNSIGEGQSTVLRWNTQNATDLKISGIGSVQQANGSQSVSPPSGTTVYVLTAKGGGGSSESSVSITVKPKAAEIAAEQPKKDTSAASGEGGDDVQGIVAARARWQNAMESMERGQIMNSGPQYSKKQIEAILNTYEHVQRIQIQETCSAQLTIQGASATWNCQETVHKVINGNPVPETHDVTFSFQKLNGNWRVVSHTGR